MVFFTAIPIYLLLFLSLFFEVFLLLSFLDVRRRKAKPRALPSKLPSVTIIVPCYNEEKTVPKTLSSLLSLDYPASKLSVIAVNDGSTDRTLAVLQEYKAKHPRITILNKENGGKHTALNFALLHTTTDLVGCLDADSYVDSQALKEIVKEFDHAHVKAVTPAIKIHNPKNLWEYIQKAEYELGIFMRKALSFVDSILVVPGPFSIFKRSVFDELGVYREAHGTEDFEMALRMQQAHYKIGNAHTALVYTTAPKNFRSLRQQRIRWVYGFIKNIIDYRHLYFQKKYGHFGVMVLPITTIAIIGALYFAGIFIYSVINRIMLKIVEVQAVGLGLTGNFSFDWFFINTQSILLLVYILVALTIFLIAMGKRLSTEKRTFSFDVIPYMVLYGFIAPVWLAIATYNALRNHRSSWTAEKGVR